MRTKLAGPSQAAQRSRRSLVRASAAWDRGNARSAFRLFLAAAKDGDVSAQLNLGYFYDEGIGVRRDPSKALRWYRRAYAAGDGSAANNIALIFREQGLTNHAIKWFERAVRAGDQDSALHLAELHTDLGDTTRAIAYLNRLVSSNRVTEHTRKKAVQLRKRSQEAQRLESRLDEAVTEACAGATIPLTSTFTH